MNNNYTLSFDGKNFNCLSYTKEFESITCIENKLLIKGIYEFIALKSPDKLFCLSEYSDVSFPSFHAASEHLNLLKKELEDFSSLIGSDAKLFSDICEMCSIDASEEAKEVNDSDNGEVSSIKWYVCSFYESEGFNFYAEKESMGLIQAEWLEEDLIESAWFSDTQREAIKRAKQVTRLTGIYAFPCAR